jgi:hypothetical protein
MALRVTDHAPEAMLAGTPRARSRAFLVALALITVVPLVGIPLIMAVAMARGTGFIPGTLTILLITGPMHVAATGFFYFDPAFRPVLGESRSRCVWSLLWLPFAIGALGLSGNALIGPWGYRTIFSLHNVWLFYHYQRQNFGLASFISTYVGTGRLPAKVNTVMNVTALGAILSLLGMPGFYPYTDAILTDRGYLVLHTAGTIVYAVSLLGTIWVFWSEPRLRESAWVTLGLLVALAFFLPTVLFQTSAMAFFPVAVAHGAQYILMMMVVSGRSSRGLIGLGIMCAVAAVAGLAMDAMRVWPVILLATGLTQVHFLVDAKVWRLREQRQRAIMNDRFDFLLAG